MDLIARIIRLVAFLTAAIVVAEGSVDASSLQVAPVSLDVSAPGKATTLTLRNSGTGLLTAQIRVFEWRQENGQETLTPATDVVASPPQAVLKSGGNYTVRLVRISEAPVRSEMAYRVIVDELPDASQPHGAGVNMVVRYSIPLFFSLPGGGPPELSWRVGRVGGRSGLVVQNTGNRRARLSSVSLAAGGRTIRFGKGLLGYVLAGSTMGFAGPQGSIPKGAAKVQATTDWGPVNAPISH